jgi:hypothetical protein
MSCNCTSYTPEQLKDAKDAYFRIASGQNVTVVIDQNGERIEYQKANLSVLADLIRRMEMELRACGLLDNVLMGHGYKPLRVYF